MSRGLALLFGAGGTFVFITLLLPHRHDEAQLALAIPAGLAYIVVAALLSAPRRFAPPALHVILFIGTSLVGMCLLFSGRAASAYAFMYVWVALYASAFFSLRGILVHLLWLSGSYALVLGISGHVHPPAAHWLLASGTSTVTAALIFWLSGELRGRANDLAAVTALANELGSASEVSAEQAALSICESVRASTDAAAAALLDEHPLTGELQLLGRAGSVEHARLMDRVDSAVLAQARESGRLERVFVGGSDTRTCVLVYPVLRDGDIGGLLAVGWNRPQRSIRARRQASVALFAAEASVALERIAHQSRDRERRALELNDAIVQGLVVATYALRNGRTEIGQQAVDDTLGRARALVESQLQALHGPAAPAPGTLRREGRGIG